MRASGDEVHDRWLASSVGNLADMYDHLGRRMDWRMARWRGEAASDGESPTFFLNAATLLQPLEESDARERAVRLDRFFAAGRGGAWLLWSAWPTPDLAEHGFTFLGHPPLMVRSTLAAQMSHPPSLRIVDVRDAATMAAFETVLVHGYPILSLQPVQVGRSFDARLLGGPARFHVGYELERPVTVARSFTSRSVVGIYCVATLPDARGRGYGAAITAHAAAAEPELPAVLQATDLGRPVYERLGFTEMARFTLWRKQRQTSNP